MAETLTTATVRMRERYEAEIRDAVQAELGLPNVMQVPRLTKIVVNMGVGQAVENKNRMDAAVKDLTAITGQKPMIRKARVAVSGFRLRIGYAVGVAVTTGANPEVRRAVCGVLDGRPCVSSSVCAW